MKLNGHMELVERMLEKGADPDMGLAGAAAGGHMELVELLLEKGADDNQLPAEFVMGENAQ